MAIGDPPNLDFDLEKAREAVVDKWPEKVPARYPVEYDPIRRYLVMVEDPNPLFHDEEYASQTKYGKVIAPPQMTEMFASPAPGRAPESEAPSVPTTLGNHFMMLGQEWEYLKPISPGDRLSSHGATVDIYYKSIKMDPKAVWSVSERRIYNQNDELVAIGRSTLCSHRTAAEVAAAGDTVKEDQ